MTMTKIIDAIQILMGATTITLVLAYWWLRLSAFCAGQDW